MESRRGWPRRRFQQVRKSVACGTAPSPAMSHLGAHSAGETRPHPTPPHHLRHARVRSVEPIMPSHTAAACPGRSRRLAALALLLLATPTVARSQERPLLRHPAGFAVPLPSGWRSTPLDASRYQLVPPDAATGEAIVIIGVSADGVTSVTDPAFIRKSDVDIREAYPQLRRTGEPQAITTSLGPAVRLDYAGMSDGIAVRMTLYLAVRNDLAITLVAVGTAPQVARRISVLDTVFARVRQDATAPTVTASSGTALTDGSATAREWSTRLSGRMLTVMSGYSSSGSSGGMTSRADLTLQRDGKFTYRRSSSVSMSVDGMGGSSSGRESAEGTWRIVTRGGRAILALNGSTGTREEFTLTRNGTQTMLNGTRAFVTTP